MELDRTDYEILRLLQNDGRLMNKQLSAAVGLAASTCHERAKRLRGAGVIAGTQAVVDPAKLGYSLSAVLFMKISKRGQIAIDALMDELVAVPEIQHVHLITGAFDLVVTMIAIDMDHLKSVVYRSFTAREEITSFETSIVYDSRHDLTVPEPHYEPLRAR